MSAISSALSSFSPGELFSSFRRKIYVQHFTGVFNSLEQHLSLCIPRNLLRNLRSGGVEERKRGNILTEKIYGAFLNSLVAKLMTSLARWK